MVTEDRVTLFFETFGTGKKKCPVGRNWELGTDKLWGRAVARNDENTSDAV